MADGRESPCALPQNPFEPTSRIDADQVTHVVNNARAARIMELANDLRNILNQVLAVRIAPSREAYNEEGYELLRMCVQEAQALLAQEFATQATPVGDEEQTRLQLRRIIADIAIRRFRAQKIFLRVYACQHWESSRRAVLQGQQPHAGHVPALQTLRDMLRAQIASVTDERVELSLRQADTAARKWLAEDPPLAVVQRVIAGR